MATLVKTDLGRWKAVIRQTGWPTTSKTFRTKRDAEDWARRTEDDMVRGADIQRARSDRLTISDASRYLSEVTPTKRPSLQKNGPTALDQLRDRCATLTKLLVQNIGQASPRRRP